MSDKVIIDGVDVSGCYFFYKGECRCELNCIDLYKNETIIELAKRTPEHNYMECKPSDNCYYKQMQRLKAENGKLLKELQYKYEEMEAKDFLLMGEDLNFWKNLKAENEMLKKEVSDLKFYIDSYRQVWEIDKYKQALEDVRDCINVLSTVDNDFKGSMVEWKINKIINEVLKSENHKQADS